MPTYTVKPSGGHYTSLSAAEAGIPTALGSGDLVTLGVVVEIACYAMSDTSPVLFNGWTTGPDNYIRVYTPTDERHNGAWDAAAYRMEAASTASAGVFGVFEEYVRVEGIQVRQTNTTTGTTALRVYPAGTSDVRIEACIVRDGGASGVPNLGCIAGTTTVTNCVVYGSPAGAGIGILGGAATIQNCTVVSNASYGITRTGSGVASVTNTYCGGHGNAPYNGVSSSLTTCMHDTSATFSGSTGNVAYTTAHFVAVAVGSEDLHLTGSSALRGAGTDLSSSFTTDIDGQTRSTPWDIGADQYIAAGPSFQAAWAAQSNQIVRTHA